MRHKKFMDIERLKPNYADVFQKGDYIIVQEKIDGANAAIRYDSETDTIVAQRYERSQQYRDIKKQFEIENDSNISTGMKALISDIVRSEVKKIIKL